MEKKKQLQEFLNQKFIFIDQALKNQHQDMARLKLVTMRSSYAKLMDNFLKNGQELSKSYLETALIYLKNGKIQQAISQILLAKRKICQIQKTDSNKKLTETVDLLLVECFQRNNKTEDALSIIEELQIECQENREKYFSLKGTLYQTLNQQFKSKQSYEKLHQLIIVKYGKDSLQEGLCMIQMGKNMGYFKNQKDGIQLIHAGIEILINKKYHNPNHVAQIYETLGELSQQIQDYQKEYSSLVCAYSMIKQLQQNSQKRSIQILNKLAFNMIRRQQKQKALEYLIQVQRIQRKIYGQSSNSLFKTFRNIIELLKDLNRLPQVCKYENQYERLMATVGYKYSANKSVSRVQNHKNNHLPNNTKTNFQKSKNSSNNFGFLIIRIDQGSFMNKFSLVDFFLTLKTIKKIYFQTTTLGYSLYCSNKSFKIALLIKHFKLYIEHFKFQNFLLSIKIYLRIFLQIKQISYLNIKYNINKLIN